MAWTSLCGVGIAQARGRLQGSQDPSTPPRQGGPTLRRYTLAVVTSVLLAQWLEAWYRFGVEWRPDLFWGAVLPYLLIAAAFHAAVARWSLPRPAWLALGALPGMTLEWAVIGNSPWANPDAIQLGMLAFHAAWPIWGRAFDPRWFGPRERRAGLWVMGGATVLLLPCAGLPSPWQGVALLLGPLMAYAALCVVAAWPRRSGVPAAS